MSTVSLPGALVERTRARIVDALGLREVPGETGGPLIPLVGAGGPVAGQSVGALRVHTGPSVLQVVTIDLVVPMFGLDSHMLFAFAHPSSPVPHFTVDAVHAGGSYAFHLDLIPRVDGGAHLAYLDAIYGPLTEIFEETRKRPGFTPAQLGPRQLALMSPWMLAARADEDAFRSLDRTVDAYLERWLAVMAGGVPSAALAEVDLGGLPGRDQRNKDAIFDPQVDPVWAQVERLIGVPVAERLRTVLKRGRA